MAASPSRSPSPITGRRNPIGRTPESGNSIRKSLGGNPAAKPSIAAPRSFNPITPANSPSDFPHRNLSSKEGIRASYEKENERDQSSLNLSKVKSPVISKGAKNFMAPTISAASKFTPSPRKKVLVERNEAVRTSTSIPDGKTSLPSMSWVQSSETEETRSKSEVGLDSQVVSDTPKISQIFPKPKTADFDSKEDLGSSSFPVLTSLELSKTEKIGSKPVMGLDSHPASDSSKIPEILPKPRTIDSDSKEDLSSSSLEFSKTEKIGSKSVLDLDPQQFSDTLKAPETQNPSSLLDSTSPDIDPSLPPYDPKTNYLSPRPRFLHYKPNPRIEGFLNKENSEGKNLEDSFTSESSSDSEPIEETQSPGAETDSADSFSPEFKAENAADSHPLEHELDENLDIVAKEIPPKSSRSSSRPKFMSLLLVLAIVCVSMSVTDSPVISSSSSMFNDHPLAKTYAPELRVLADRYLRDSFAEITEFASVNLGRVSDNLRLWSLNSMSYLARMISVPRGGELGVIHFMNLTALDTDISSVNKLLTDVNQIKDTGENEEENSSEELKMEGETQQGVQEEQGLVKEEQHHYSEALQTVHEMEVTEKPREATVLGEQQEDQISHPLITAEEIEEAEGIEENSESNSRADTVPTDLEFSSQNSHFEETVEAEEIEEKGVSDSYADIVEPTNVEISAQNLHSEEIMEAEEIEEKGLSNSYADIEPTSVEISAQILHSEEIEEKVISNSHADIEPTNVELSAQSSHSDPDHEACSSPEVLDATIRAPADDFTMQIVLGVSSVLLTLAAAAAASFYLKKSKVSVSEAEIQKQPLSPKKMTSDSVSASSQSHRDIDRPLFYKNCPAEVEMAGESGPLEMSSSLEEDSFSTSQRSSDRVESISNERKLRRNSNRESMVSSSEYSAGSPSYGSFTTYEKLHKVSGDDDAMTPVRRSSRLRKQITSP